MSSKLQHEIYEDDRAERLCNELISEIMSRKIYCELDSETAVFLDEELLSVQTLHKLFQENDSAAKERILAEFPAKLAAYQGGDKS